MKREARWILVACAFGLVIQFALQRQLNAALGPVALGIAISVAILTLIAVENRASVTALKAQNRDIEFMIRPWHALGIATFIYLAFLGAVFLGAYLSNDFDQDFAQRIDSLPIFAVGFGLYNSAYMR